MNAEYSQKMKFMQREAIEEKISAANRFGLWISFCVYLACLQFLQSINVICFESAVDNGLICLWVLGLMQVIRLEALRSTNHINRKAYEQ